MPYICTMLYKLGFPCGSAGKESACNVEDLGSIPGLGRSPGEGKGYPLQYSGLENSMDCMVHGVAKSQTWLSTFHFHFTQVLHFELFCWLWGLIHFFSGIFAHSSTYNCYLNLILFNIFFVIFLLRWLYWKWFSCFWKFYPFLFLPFHILLRKREPLFPLLCQSSTNIVTTLLLPQTAFSLSFINCASLDMLCCPLHHNCLVFCCFHHILRELELNWM